MSRTFLSYILDFRYSLDHTLIEVAMEDMIGSYHIHKALGIAFPHQLVKMIGDRLFGSGIAESALMYAEVSNQPVYMYRFGYIGSRSLIKHFNLSKIDELEASHGEDCHYILDLDDSTVESEDDLIMSEKMTRMWGEFVSNSIHKLEEHIFLADMREKLPRLSYIEIESPSRMYVTSTENMSNMLYWREYLLREIATIGKKDESSSSALKLSYFPLIVISFFVGLLVWKYFLQVVHKYLLVIIVKIHHVLWRKHHS
ncbi:esterase FE4 [Nilaparvata lugens]|uniref:esterase FE4 n=1 Tax=Nilaparvata lugens TaxID=108931 RepID=UPI00193E4A49|nr:esterase FE4 [Nilaparvata lugens]